MWYPRMSYNILQIETVLTTVFFFKTMRVCYYLSELLREVSLGFSLISSIYSELKCMLTLEAYKWNQSGERIKTQKFGCISEYWGLGRDFKRHRFGKILTMCWNYKIHFFSHQGGFGICEHQTCTWQYGDMRNMFIIKLFL